MPVPFRLLYLAVVAAMTLLAASCTEKPKATDPDKTATVVPATTMSASDSTAVTPRDSMPK